MPVKKICSKCGRSRNEDEFFKMRTGERYDMCKDCLTQYIDNRKPETFLWILEAFDVPYIESKWVELTNNHIKKGKKLTPRSIIGTYIRTMNMTQYNKLRYADSDRLNFADKKVQQESEAATLERAALEAELRKRLEAGEITQAQYDTLAPAPEDSTDIADKIMRDPSEPLVQIDDFLDLTEEDQRYLALKWGTVYRPDQWVAMEQMYNDYAQEYELDVDREQVLKQMCKTNLKMNESIDAGDTKGYKDLSYVFDQLRKSASFTKAQNKENKKRELDSIGELVKLAEQKGGPIRPYIDPYDYPQDKIDFTIKDIQTYIYNLVTKEHGLGNLIESYIEKLEKKEAMEAAGELTLDGEFVTSREEEEAQRLTTEEELEWQAHLERLQEEDRITSEAEELVERFNTEVIPHES